MTGLGKVQQDYQVLSKTIPKFFQNESETGINKHEMSFTWRSAVVTLGCWFTDDCTGDITGAGFAAGGGFAIWTLYYNKQWTVFPNIPNCFLKILHNLITWGVLAGWFPSKGLYSSSPCWALAALFPAACCTEGSW